MRLSLKRRVGGRWGSSREASECGDRVPVTAFVRFVWFLEGVGESQSPGPTTLLRMCPHLSPAVIQDIIPSWLPSDPLLLRQLE